MTDDELADQRQADARARAERRGYRLRHAQITHTTADNEPAPDPLWRCWTGCPTSGPACRFYALCRPGAQPPRRPQPKEPRP